MAHTLNVLDRLRIERYVWSVDQQIYDIPRASRIAKRRELRGNLLSAAADVGTSAALRGLGPTRRLALDYLAAEFDDQPRPSWIAAAYVGGAAPLVLNFVLGLTATAYQEAISAANPHASGTFTWHGVSYLQSAVTFQFADGHADSQLGGAWTPLTYVLLVLGAVLAGRLWRLVPRSGRRTRGARGSAQSA